MDTKQNIQRNRNTAQDSNGSVIGKMFIFGIPVIIIGIYTLAVVQNLLD